MFPADSTRTLATKQTTASIETGSAIMAPINGEREWPGCGSIARNDSLTAYDHRYKAQGFRGCGVLPIKEGKD
jgi:hypothetical protein